VKKFFLISLTLLFAASISAQEIDTGKNAFGFGSPVIKLTKISKEFGILIGARGGWVIDEKFIIGGGGYGLLMSNDVEINPNDPKAKINFGYLGFEIEYAVVKNNLFSVSLITLVGGGALSFTEIKTGLDLQRKNLSDTFIIVEPGINVYLNVMKAISIGTGISYRFLSEEKSGYPYKIDITGLSVGVNFRFGY